MGCGNAKAASRQIAHQRDLLGTCWDITEQEAEAEYVRSRWWGLSTNVMQSCTGNKCYALRTLHAHHDPYKLEQSVNPTSQQHVTEIVTSLGETPRAALPRGQSLESFSYLQHQPCSNTLGPSPQHSDHVSPSPANASHTSTATLRTVLRDTKELESGVQNRHPYLRTHALSVMRGVVFRVAPARRRYARISLVPQKLSTHSEPGPPEHLADVGAGPFSHGCNYPILDSDDPAVSGTTPPVIIGSISAQELLALGSGSNINADICVGGWLYISLQDEHDRLRRCVRAYMDGRDQRVELLATKRQQAAFGQQRNRSPDTRSHSRKPRSRAATISPNMSPSPSMWSVGAISNSPCGPPLDDSCSREVTSQFLMGRGGIASEVTSTSLNHSPAVQSLLKSKSVGIYDLGTPVQPTRLVAASTDALRPTQTFTVGDSLQTKAISAARPDAANERDDPVWVPYGYVVVALPMYECGTLPTAHAQTLFRGKPISFNMANPSSRKAFGVGTISMIRYGGITVIECRDTASIAEGDEWVRYLAALAQQYKVVGADNQGSNDVNGSTSSEDEATSAVLTADNRRLLHVQHRMQVAKTHDIKRQLRTTLVEKYKLYVVMAETKVMARQRRVWQRAADAKRAYGSSQVPDHFNSASHVTTVLDSMVELMFPPVPRRAATPGTWHINRARVTSIRGTFRQIGGLMYLDAGALMDGCALSDVLTAVARWTVNLLCMPVKARPISIFLQRYEGIAHALRMAPNRLTAMVIKNVASGESPTANAVLLNASFQQMQPNALSSGPQGSQPPGPFPAAASVSGTGVEAAPSIPLMQYGMMQSAGLAYHTFYTGPLDPVVEPILSAEVAAMLDNYVHRREMVGSPTNVRGSPNGAAPWQPSCNPAASGGDSDSAATLRRNPSSFFHLQNALRHSTLLDTSIYSPPTSPNTRTLRHVDLSGRSSGSPITSPATRGYTFPTSSSAILKFEAEEEYHRMDQELRTLRSELDEVQFLVNNARVELTERLEDYVTFASLFLPHTRVDQSSLVMLFMKMLRLFPEDVPVKELGTDWLPTLMCLFTTSNEELVAEHIASVRPHQGSYSPMSLNDVCDANRAAGAVSHTTGESAGGAYSIVGRPSYLRGRATAPRVLRELVIAPAHGLINKGVAAALEHAGVDSQLSFCFTGGSFGVMAAALRFYADSLRVHYHNVMSAAAEAGTRDECKTSAEVLCQGRNVFLRKVLVWGATQGSKHKRKKASTGCGDGRGVKVGGGRLRDIADICDEHGMYSVSDLGVAFTPAEVFTFFDAVAYYLHTFVVLERAHTGTYPVARPVQRRSLLLQLRGNKRSEHTGAAAHAGVSNLLVEKFELCIASGTYHKSVLVPTVTPLPEDYDQDDAEDSIIEETPSPSREGSEQFLSSPSSVSNAASGGGGGAPDKESVKSRKNKRAGKRSDDDGRATVITGNHPRGSGSAISPSDAERPYCGGEEEKLFKGYNKPALTLFRFVEKCLSQWRSKLEGSSDDMESYCNRITVTMA